MQGERESRRLLSCQPLPPRIPESRQSSEFLALVFLPQELSAGQVTKEVADAKLEPIWWLDEARKE